MNNFSQGISDIHLIHEQHSTSFCGINIMTPEVHDDNDTAEVTPGIGGQCNDEQFMTPPKAKFFDKNKSPHSGSDENKSSIKGKPTIIIYVEPSEPRFANENTPIFNHECHKSLSLKLSKHDKQLLN